MLFGARVEAEADLGPRGAKPRAEASRPRVRSKVGRLMVGLPQWARNIMMVETKQKAMTN